MNLFIPCTEFRLGGAIDASWVGVASPLPTASSVPGAESPTDSLGVDVTGDSIRAALRFLALLNNCTEGPLG